MIAIHNSNTGFHPRWIAYCNKNGIPYKLVDCYANDIIDQLKDCKALMWHHSHTRAKDIIMAKSLLFSLEQAGIKVFPDFRTAWHFDDKIGQKYLLESINAPFISTYIFYDKTTAINWAEKTEFPKVFKLRGGAGSSNVTLVKNTAHANKVIKKSFGAGYPQFNPWESFKDRYSKFNEGKTNLTGLVKGLGRFFYIPRYSKVMGREMDYVYFQDFIPNNDCDIRIIVIGHKAFALKRMVRKNDFRASGSGNFRVEKKEFDERCVKISFEVTKTLDAQCVAYDFVFDKSNAPLIIEISYGFLPEGYDNCSGFWDGELNWYEGKFNPYGWMVELLV